MAFSLAGIRSGLSAVITPVIDGEWYDYAPDNPVTPCAIPFVGDIDYHQAFGKGLLAVPIQIAVLEASAVTDEAQRALDTYLSSGTGQSNSLIDALQHSSLGGACQELHVLGTEAYGEVSMGDERRFFGVLINTVVYCDRK